MRIFVTGATGWIGSAVVPELLDAGHQVLGLARSDAAAASVAALGAEVHRGDLDDLDSLRAAAAASDGVVHLGYNHDFSRMEAAAQTDLAAINAIGAALEGTDRPFVIASGVLGLASGRAATEQDTPDPAVHPRIAGAQAALSFADRGVRPSSCGSLRPSTAPAITASSPPWSASPARRASPATSTTAATGGPRCTDSTPRTSSVSPWTTHRPARRCTPIAEEGVPTRAIAEAIGRGLDLPVVSIPADQAGDHFGWIGALLRHRLPRRRARRPGNCSAGSPSTPDSSPTSTPATTSRTDRDRISG